MTERPILFSAPMVRAILDGRKTQTRRIVKPQPPSYIDELHGNDLRGRAPYQLECDETGCNVGSGFQDDNGIYYKCPYGTVGGRLWVREAFHKISGNTRACVYRASCENGSEKNYKFTPSIHMPYWASRITLGITGVRVERLQDITGEDCAKEGIEPNWEMFYEATEGADGWDEPEEFIEECEEECDWVNYGSRLVESSEHREWERDRTSYALRLAFRDTWQSIYGPDSWDENPWVWVLEFEKM